MEYADFEKYKNEDFSNDDWIKMLPKNPKLIKEPIAIRGYHVIYVKTPSDLSLL